MSDEELRDAVEEISIFVRVDPEHKLRIVKALKEIDTMDIEHIERLLALANGVKEQSQPSEDVQQANTPQQMSNMQGMQTEGM